MTDTRKMSEVPFEMMMVTAFANAHIQAILIRARADYQRSVEEADRARKRAAAMDAEVAAMNAARAAKEER